MSTQRRSGSNIRELTKEESVAFLKSQLIGTLSLTDNKSAYAVPMAYLFDADSIFFNLAPEGRKHGYIKANQSACFSTYEVKADPSNPMVMSWKSVICDGKVERVMDSDELTRTVRLLEKSMGKPEGSMQKLLERTLKNPTASNFWKIKTTAIGGRGVEGFKEELEE